MYLKILEFIQNHSNEIKLDITEKNVNLVSSGKLNKWTKLT